MTHAFDRLYDWRRVLVLVVISSAEVMTLASAPTALRLLTVLPAFLLCPGLAILGAAQLDGTASVLVLSVPVSAAVSVVAAQALLTTHAFNAQAALAIIAGICVLAVTCDYVRSARRGCRDRILP